MKTDLFELELKSLYTISQKFGQVLDLDHTLMALTPPSNSEAFTSPGKG